MMDWQPIESAPRAKDVLLYFPAIAPRLGQREYAQGAMMKVGVADASPRKATHWMPLPLAPTEAGTAKTENTGLVHEGGK